MTFVTNHGGRVVDSGLSTIEVLPEIARSVGGRIPSQRLEWGRGCEWYAEVARETG